MAKDPITNHLHINPIDLLNALFITIILYLHHGGYTVNYFNVLNTYKINALLQKFAVGGFFFFSGYKLSVSYIDLPIYTFWKKRFKRVYILYAIALIVTCFTNYPYFNDGEYPSLNNIIVHFLCLQSVFPNLFGPLFKTVWFVSVLFFCHIYFVLTRSYLSNIKKFYPISLIVYLAISLLYLITGNSNFRIFKHDLPIYFLFFSSGMVYSKSNHIQISKNALIKIFIVCSALLLIIYNHISINTYYEYYTWSLLILLGNICIFIVILEKLDNTTFSYRISFLFSKYSFASFSIFLFHRVIWSVMANIYPKGSFLQWLFIIIFGTTTIVVVSYYIQKTYNIFIKLSTTNRSTRTR